MRVDTLAHRKNTDRTTTQLRNEMNASFGQRAGRISFEATMAHGDAVRLRYLQDNPNHIGMAEIDLKAAEHELESALTIVRQLRARVEREREVQHMEAAE
jgi:hypothetical protein